MEPMGVTTRHIVAYHQCNNAHSLVSQIQSPSLPVLNQYSVVGINETEYGKNVSNLNLSHSQDPTNKC